MSHQQPKYSEPFFYDSDRSDPRNRIWKKIVPPFTPHRGLKRGEDISIASWNLNCTSRYAPERVAHALYLLQNYYHKNYQPFAKSRGVFIPPPHLRLVILFQGINRAGFQVILDSPFVQDNFLLSDSHIYTDDVRQSTVTMISKDLPISKVFRVPFRHTKANRDALFVDIAIQNEARARVPPTSPPRPGVPFHDVLRIANTELESHVDSGALLRPYQLAMVQEYLTPAKPQIDPEVIVVGGLLGASMGVTGPDDHHHLPRLFGLRDLWKEHNPTVDEFRPFDLEQQRHEKGKRLGHTFGYQPFGQYRPGRVDKILASGIVSGATVMRMGVGQKCKITSPGDLHYGAREDAVYTSPHYGLTVVVNVPPHHTLPHMQLALSGS
ncbi:hypothetical protein BJ508DRAFT_412608 [Ascobolus immersus RN42]|uniref:Uncharacterized protein n=1 Tax=Ascobolus immersus RN42 TaxID=1160509 RepID=A0A3N4IGH9_ASCIM|nr:hypothetical protein BJ508DRAFT_412608 [Ascobolus immersus RN42]